MSTAEIAGVDAGSRLARMSDSDVLALRRAYYNDGTISESEASRLLKLAVTYAGESDAWPHFFIESLTDFLVHQSEPRGYLSAEQADWLLARIAHDGQVTSGPVLELLVKILETATEVPEKLTLFALGQIKTAVLEGDARLLSAAPLQPGVIGEAEVALLRRILYAAGGDHNAAISRAEAEILFDLNDATVAISNHWSWSDLFAKAIVNHLMAANHYYAMSRKDALGVASWLETPSEGTTGFLARTFTTEMLTAKGMYAAMQDVDPQWGRLATMYEDEAAAEKLTAGEADWLAKRIGRDGILHENEKAVLRFIRDECPEIHEGLQPLLAQITD